MAHKAIAPAHLYKNQILRNLAPEIVDRLALKPVTLEIQRELEAPDQPIRNLFFIESGLGSMTCMLLDGSQVEVGLFGYESVIGVSALMGTKHSLNRVFMQLAGHGFMCPIEVGRKEFERGGDFQRLALRYVQAQLTQTMQSAACNAKHDVDQRFARWLLLCADRTGALTFNISQEFLSQMLGTTRPSVTICIGRFTHLGLIEHQRSQITILKREALEKVACECYTVVREHLNNYVNMESGFGI